MLEIISAAQKSAVFSDVNTSELPALLTALHPVVRSFRKGEILVMAGYTVQEMGLILAGEANAIQLNAAGDALSVATLRTGDVFGDILAASKNAHSPVTVQAVTQCRVAFVRHSAIFTPLGHLHSAQCTLLQSMMRSAADKYFAQQLRMSILAEKTLRAKLLHWVAAQGGNPVALPPRAQLAAYLGCERAALCRVLSQMKNAGEIKIKK